MNITPLSDRVLLEPIAAEEKTASGLYMPAPTKDTPGKARVVAVGPGRTSESGVLIPTQVKVGDVVLYDKLIAAHVTIDGKQYRLTQEYELLAVVRE